TNCGVSSRRGTTNSGGTKGSEVTRRYCRRRHAWGSTSIAARAGSAVPRHGWVRLRGPDRASAGRKRTGGGDAVVAGRADSAPRKGKNDTCRAGREDRLLRHGHLRRPGSYWVGRAGSDVRRPPANTTTAARDAVPARLRWTGDRAASDRCVECPGHGDERIRRA